jgi:hypothetical protein
MSKYLAAALAVAGVVSGQYYTISGTVYTSTTTTTVAGSSVSTVTGVVAVTTPAGYTSVYLSCVPTTMSAVGPFVTIFNTVYVDTCPTGTTQITYTITDTCGCQHASQYVAPTGAPSGFTVTQKVCTACPGQPTITVTTPIGGAAPAATVNPAVNIAPAATVNSNVVSTVAPATRPSYLTTSGAVAKLSDSIIASFLAMMMSLVAGLMFVL